MTVKNERNPYTASEEDFRTIVCSITGLQPNDAVFDRIDEQDKRVIKTYSRAIDMGNAINNYDSPSRIKRTKGGIINPADIPENK